MKLIRFTPHYMQRVWGGRKLESIYNRVLPDESLYGESWEISDRSEAQSVVADGLYKGETLQQLWSNRKEEVFGFDLPNSDKFPLLIKILDASEDLSIQVHPPVTEAKKYNGEVKNEFWYIAERNPDSKLYVGLKDGVTKEEFKQAIHQGSVAKCVHEISPNKDDYIYIPSGRLHAIGKGFLIYEIQQNSDTTYRVFDWNRLGLDDKPRELHVEQSLSCINFEDFKPQMHSSKKAGELSVCENFEIHKRNFQLGECITPQKKYRFAIWIIIQGQITEQGKVYGKGDFLLAPVGIDSVTASKATSLLEVTTSDIH